MNRFNQHTIEEKKDHLINKLQLLTPEEKELIIRTFSKKPHLEKMIDWNNKNLTFQDFIPALRSVSKTEKKKAFKHKGIKGLKEGTDYAHLKCLNDQYQAYIPLHVQASQLIASQRIGNCEGKWCIASNQGEFHWKTYVKQNALLPIYVVTHDNKYAIMVYKGHSKWDVWNAKDDLIKESDMNPPLDIKRDIINPNKKELDRIREEIINYNFVQDAKTKGAEYTILSDGAYWKHGEWIDGNWLGGTWHDGVWRYGTFKGGLWEGGTWHDGHWHNGHFLGGQWLKGYFHSGLFADAEWFGGKWKGGKFQDGIWHGGLWEDGVWRNGRWIKGDWTAGTWMSGVWDGGTWWGGEWIRGLWKDGTWYGGNWHDGTWWNGKWYGGSWRRGIWQDGVFSKGEWWDGEWHGGTFMGGDWLGGKWLGGQWMGGRDKRGRWHDPDDSPDKWDIV